MDGLVIQLTGGLTLHTSSTITVMAVNGDQEKALTLTLTEDSGANGEGIFRVSAEDLGTAFTAAQL